MPLGLMKGTFACTVERFAQRRPEKDQENEGDQTDSFIFTNRKTVPSDAALIPTVDGMRGWWYR